MPPEFGRSSDDVELFCSTATLSNQLHDGVDRRHDQIERDHHDCQKKEERLIAIRTKGISKHSIDDVVQYDTRHPGGDDQEKSPRGQTQHFTEHVASPLTASEVVHYTPGSLACTPF